MNITAIQGDNQAECPKCGSYFHVGFLKLHILRCNG